MRVDGQSLSREIIERLRAEPLPRKILAAILVGNDPRSISFLKQKEKIAEELGVDFRLYRLGPELGNDRLRKEIGSLAQKRRVGGVVVQLPLPDKINSFYVLNVIPREKDIDVLTERTLGAFYHGRNPVFPPAVQTVKTILEKVRFDLEKAEVALVGLGTLIGKPISLWLTGKCRGLFLLHRQSDFELLRRADLVISGVGEPALIKPEFLKPGVGVVDFGYYFARDKVQGDFDIESLEDESKLGFYTPTPGGTGPILVANLFRNFYTLCQVYQKKK